MTIDGLEAEMGFVAFLIDGVSAVMEKGTKS